MMEKLVEDVKTLRLDLNSTLSSFDVSHTPELSPSLSCPSLPRLPSAKALVELSSSDFRRNQMMCKRKPDYYDESSMFDRHVRQKTQRNNSKRRGKWELEEERFAQKIIQGFLDGILPIERGTTLRSFLAKQLDCDPMRITKKLASSTLAGHKISERVGKRTYRSSNMIPLNKIKKRISILRQLHREFWATIAQDPPEDAMKFALKQASAEDIETASALLDFATSSSRRNQIAHPA